MSKHTSKGSFIFSHYAENLSIIIKDRGGRIVYRGQGGTNDAQRMQDIFYYLRVKLGLPVYWGKKKKEIIEDEIQVFGDEFKKWL